VSITSAQVKPPIEALSTAPSWLGQKSGGSARRARVGRDLLPIACEGTANTF